MKRILLTLLLSLSSISIFAQSFEGDITYQNIVKSKLPNVNDQQLQSMMGNTANYYISGSDYKSVTNGTLILWQMYTSGDNKLYTKLSNSETILWNDAAINPDSVISTEFYPAGEDVLGYKCDELVLNCKSGVEKFYFSTKLPVDSKLYANHAYGNWYAYLSKANALPLKMIIDNPQLTMISIATEVKPMHLDKTFFTLPAGAKTAKSPY